MSNYCVFILSPSFVRFFSDKFSEMVDKIMHILKVVINYN